MRKDYLATGGGRAGLLHLLNGAVTRGSTLHFRPETVSLQPFNLRGRGHSLETEQVLVIGRHSQGRGMESHKPGEFPVYQV